MTASFASLPRFVLGFALAIATVAISALGLTAFGGTGSSQEELTQTRKLTAFHVHREERLRRLEREVETVWGRRASIRVEVAGAPPTPGSYAPSYRSAASYGSAVGSSGACGGELSVNSRTSCPFAENVEQAYYAEVGSGSGEVSAYSPVTERSYVMYCSGSPHECSGGDGAALYFP